MAKSREELTTSALHRAWGDWLDAHSARVEEILQTAVRTELHMYMELCGDDLMHESVESAVHDWLDVHGDQIVAYLVHQVRQQRLKEPM